MNISVETVINHNRCCVLHSVVGPTCHKRLAVQGTLEDLGRPGDTRLQPGGRAGAGGPEGAGAGEKVGNGE